jgi:acetyltransferase-like isoleucine patch superfamily enzyme
MKFYPHLLEGLSGYLHCQDTRYIKRSVVLDLSADITLGDGIIISDEAMLYTHEHDHTLESNHLKVWARSKYIGSNVYIGARAIILANCTHIPDGVVIGAGSVVTKSIEKDFSYTIWAGNPARLIRPRFPTNGEDFTLT